MPLGLQAGFPETLLLLKCEQVTPSWTGFPSSPLLCYSYREVGRGCEVGDDGTAVLGAPVTAREGLNVDTPSALTLTKGAETTLTAHHHTESRAPK